MSVCVGSVVAVGIGHEYGHSVIYTKFIIAIICFITIMIHVLNTPYVLPPTLLDGLWSLDITLRACPRTLLVSSI